MDSRYSLSKKFILPAHAGFEITFLPRVSRGKKLFYPHKCASDTSLRSAYATRRCAYATRRLTPYATVRAARMLRRKTPSEGFSTVSIGCPLWTADNYSPPDLLPERLLGLLSLRGSSSAVYARSERLARYERVYHALKVYAKPVKQSRGRLRGRFCDVLYKL